MNNYVVELASVLQYRDMKHWQCKCNSWLSFIWGPWATNIWWKENSNRL